MALFTVLWGLLAFAYLIIGAFVGCFGFALMPPVLGHWAVRAGTGLLFGGVVTGAVSGMVPPSGEAAVPSFFVSTLLVAGWAWGWLHDPIRRWQYHLTPHPAEEAVRRATKDGRPLDAAAIAALSAPINTGDPFRDQVLAEQARALTERWQAHEARLRAEEVALWAHEAAEARKRNELLAAERDLLAAAVAHEQQAARVAALRRERGENG